MYLLLQTLRRNLSVQNDENKDLQCRVTSYAKRLENQTKEHLKTIEGLRMTSEPVSVAIQVSDPSL